MPLEQKVMLVFREVIERASPTRDEQTDVNTKNPASVCILPLHYIYTVNARYAESAFGRLTTRAIINFKICTMDLCLRHL